MPDSLYDTDFYAWTRDQADKLRRLAAARSNVDLDLEHLAEEVEDLGSELRYRGESLLQNVIEHLLKLEYSPAVEPRRVWRRDTLKARQELGDRLTRTIRNHLEATLNRRFAKARKAAAHGLEEDGVRADDLPVETSYTLEQLLDEDWYPVNRHGLD